MGKLIILEGTDATGKSTQFERLCTALSTQGREFRRLRFPQYESESSALVRMYLHGEFGDDPEAVNAYGASLFYAVDRYASFVKDWGEYYKNGGLLISDRYTTSNAFHQGTKLPESELPGYLKWLEETEYGHLGLPKPNLVLLLDMPMEISIKLMSGRGGGADIHENNWDYLASCRECARRSAEILGWKKIDCTRNGELRTIEDIGNEIFSEVSKVL